MFTFVNNKFMKIVLSVSCMHAIGFVEVVF